MKVEVKLSGVDGVLDLLKSLPPEVVSKRGGPVKLALAKGARLIRDEAKQNLRRAIAMNGDESTGLLEKSVISSRGKPPSSGKGERYLVRVKNRRYPDRRSEVVKAIKKNRGVRKQDTTLQTANLLEYGSENQPATPWLRPAVTQHGQRAITVITEDLKKRIDKVVAGLSKKGTT